MKKRALLERTGQIETRNLRSDEAREPFMILWIGSMDESSHESRFSNPVRIRTISSVWLFTAARAAFRSAARVLIASELSTREAGRKPAARSLGRPGPWIGEAGDLRVSTWIPVKDHP